MPACLDEFEWVDLFSVEQNFVVHVRPGASPRTAKKADLMPMPYFLAFLNRRPEKVCVPRSQAIAVIDLHHAAVTAFSAGIYDDAFGGREYRCPFPAGEIEPVVHRAALGKRIAPHAETTRQMVMVHRRNQRQRFQDRL